MGAGVCAFPFQEAPSTPSLGSISTVAALASEDPAIYIFHLGLSPALNISQMIPLMVPRYPCLAFPVILFSIQRLYEHFFWLLSKRHIRHAQRNPAVSGEVVGERYLLDVWRHQAWSGCGILKARATIRSMPFLWQSMLTICSSIALLMP